MDKPIYLYLDDKRNPFLLLGKDILNKYTVVWVRSHVEFVDWILDNKLPHTISFDHDLAPEHYTPKYFWDDYEESKKYQEFVKQDYKFKTGEDSAKYIVRFCNGHKYSLPICKVHSANPVGAENIQKYLDNFLEARHGLFYKNKLDK